MGLYRANQMKKHMENEIETADYIAELTCHTRNTSYSHNKIGVHTLREVPPCPLPSVPE